jgi:hypothetical protein
LSEISSGERGKSQAEVPSTRKVNVFANIRVDAAFFDIAKRNVRGSSYDDLIAEGNLLLLADNPYEARKRFLAACVIERKGKKLFAAVEGLARTVKASTGSESAAIQFIYSLRLLDSNGSVPPEFVPAGLTLADLRLAAQRIDLPTAFADSYPSVTAPSDNGEARMQAVASINGPRTLLHSLPERDIALEGWFDKWSEDAQQHRQLSVDAQTELDNVLNQSSLTYASLFELGNAIVRETGDVETASHIYARGVVKTDELLKDGYGRADPDQLKTMMRSLYGVHEPMWEAIQKGNQKDNRGCLPALSLLYADLLTIPATTVDPRRTQ